MSIQYPHRFLSSHWRWPLVGVLTASWLSACLSSLVPPAMATEHCLFLSQPQRFNTLETNLETGSIIYIGKLPNHPYLVIIPGNDPTTFSQVRSCVLDALQGSSGLGDYILVGNFAQRTLAEDLANTLRETGYPAQVIHQSRFR
jgi:hypothetical protein